MATRKHLTDADIGVTVQAFGAAADTSESTSFVSNGGWISEVEAYVLAENLGYDLEAELKQYQFNGALKPLWIDVGTSSEYVRVNADASFPYGYSAANQALFEKYSGRGVMPFISEALGNSGTIYNLVSNSSLRTAFITAAVADAVALGWRGIAVDIEGFGTWNATTTNHYYDFLTEFAAATKAAGKILSVYIPPIWNTAANTESGSGDEWDSANSSSYYQLTYASLNAITDVDFWEIPLYDYEFDYGSERPEAPLRWIADVVSFAKSQFDDINKLVIGVSAQGHFGADGDADFNNWTYAQASANADFGTATRNAESGELYWKPSTINYWIADDETQNIRRRLLESLGIRRMSIWYLGDNKYGSMKSVKTTNNGSLVLTRIDSPVVANADEVNIFGRNIGGRMLPAFMSPSGLDSALQPLIARNKIAWANPVGNATTLSVVGIALSATGTATSANVAVTNVHTAQRRLEYAVTTASATAVAGWRDTTAKYFLGNGFGGFTYVCRFGPSRGVAADATRRFFNGFTSVTSAPTDVNPSTIANCLGVGADSTDTNWQFMHRTGTGTVVKVDTGIPKSAADTTEAYELAMFTAPDSGVVHMEFTRMATGDVVRYAATSSLPASTTLLAPRGWTSVGGTSSVVGISLISLYIETDY